MKIHIRCCCGTELEAEHSYEFSQLRYLVGEFAEIHRECADRKPVLDEAMSRDATRVERPLYERSTPGVVAL